MTGMKFLFQMLAVSRHRETEAPEYEGDKRVRRCVEAAPFRIGEGGLRRAQEIKQANNQH